MNSTLADSASLISTSTRIKNPVERIRPRSDFYLWFFGQIHAKRLLVTLMVLLTLFSLYALTWPTDAHFSNANVPGFDGKPIFGILKHSTSGNTPSIVVSIEPIFGPPPDQASLTDLSEDAMRNRNILTIIVYFYLASVLLAAVSIRWAERVWLCGSNAPCVWINPAFLLIPFLLSILSFGMPLFCWSVQIARNFHHHSCYDQNPQIIDCTSPSFIFTMTLFVIIPEILVWCFFLYICYGIALAFVYIWRRSHAGWKGKESAAASFSWSFRDKNTLLGRNGQYGLDNNKNFGSRLMIGRESVGRSGRSTKTTSRPTLRGFISRFNDNMNDTRGSALSADGDNSLLNRTNGSDVCIEVEAGDVADELNFSRRVLDTVMEERESQHGSQESLSNRQ